MKQFTLSTTEGDFLLPDQWKLLVGSAVLARKQTFKQRLRSLGIRHHERVRSKLEVLSEEFKTWLNSTDQRRIGIYSSNIFERRKNTMKQRYGVEYRGQLTPAQIHDFLLSHNILSDETIFNKLPYIKHQGKCLTCGNTFTFHFTVTAVPTVCPYCNKASTSFERQLAAKLKLYTKTIQHFKLPSGKEIDIYLPDLKIGIEVNGIISHNSTKSFASFRGYGDVLPKSEDYHLRKTEEALSIGINLLHIWEHEPVSSKGLDFLFNKVLKGKSVTLKGSPAEFKLRRDFFPSPLTFEGYTYTWKPEIWYTDKRGKPLSKDDPDVLVTYTSGLWIYTRNY